MKFDVPDLAGWRTRRWVLGAVTLLVLTLTPLTWIQWRQFEVLNTVADKQVDSIMWQAYQMERELARLRRLVESANDRDAAVTPDDLQERFDVFLSRVDLMIEMPRRDLLERSPVFQPTMDKVQAFVAQTEPLLDDAAALIQQPEQLRRLMRAIDELQPQLADLTREGNRAGARYIDERNAQLRQQSWLVIGLAAAQILVLLLFVLVLVRHILHQQRQYAQLQQLSRELSTARDLAEAANHSKSVFLANMSHEIRTPFQGLLGMLNLLDEPNLNQHQRDYLQTARDSALHLLGVLNDILDLSTMESGTLKLSVAPINLRGVVQEVDGLMQVAAAEKGLPLDIFVAPELPTWFMADATRLRQILFNLINNAIKFTPHGRVTVDIKRPADGAPGLQIEVRDTGMGMDSATLQQLFTRFYQADNSLRRRAGGTGLGLEISRNLARMMGGDIEASSELGRGSVFTVTLPLPVTEPTVRDSILPGGGAGNSQRLRVLVAEDHPINLKYMSILLEKMGHDAVYCENGREALELIQRQPFDVALLDYHMPELDGLATTEAIRMLQKPACDVKVILVTADVVNDTRKKALEAGVDEFVSKPLQALDLRRSLERCGLRKPAQDEQATDGRDPPDSTLSSRFPMSTYEAPVRLPEGEAPSPDVIDLDTYRDIVAMMPADTMETLLNTLFEPPTGTLTLLLQALKDGNCNREAIGFHAHKLKGTALLLGFMAIARTAARIEHQSCETTEALNIELAQQLLNDMEATLTGLRHFEMDQANR